MLDLMTFMSWLCVLGYIALPIAPKGPCDCSSSALVKSSQVAEPLSHLEPSDKVHQGSECMLVHRKATASNYCIGFRCSPKCNCEMLLFSAAAQQNGIFNSFDGVGVGVGTASFGAGRFKS